jgi:hypothetical protein
MVSGRPNTQGGLTPITDPAHFPSSFASLQKKMQPDPIAPATEYGCTPARESALADFPTPCAVAR